VPVVVSNVTFVAVWSGAKIRKERIKTSRADHLVGGEKTWFPCDFAMRWTAKSEK
jgi:hypothetical protein